MHSDLMRPPRLDLHIKQRESSITPTHAVQRESGATSAHDRHPRAVARVARDWLFNASALLLDATVNERDVGFENLTRAKLIRQIFMRGFRFGDDDEAGSVLVETMNDARPRELRIADCGLRICWLLDCGLCFPVSRFRRWGVVLVLNPHSAFRIPESV